MPKDRKKVERNMALSGFTAQLTKRRMLISFVVIVISIGLVSIVVNAYRNPKESESLLGMDIRKPGQCLKDSDCPDATYCNEYGMCIPAEMLPKVSPLPVLGRGRGAEGTDVFLVSDEQRGQN